MKVRMRDTAVYWGSPTHDGDGSRSFAAPKEIRCRWDRSQQLFVDGQGQERRSNAVVYLPQAVDLDAYLYLGRLDDLTTAQRADPQLLSDSLPIRAFEDVASIVGGGRVRRAFL